MLENAVSKDQDAQSLQNRITQLEAALHTAQLQASWLVRFPDTNPNPVMRVSPEGILLYQNSAAAGLPGWACSVDERLSEPMLSLVQQAMPGGLPVEQDIALAGVTYWVSVVPIPDEGFANVYGRDISARKNAEKALAESRQRLEHILKSLGDGLLALDRQWRISYVNRIAAEITGQPADQLVGKIIWDLWPGLIGTPLEACYRQAMQMRLPGQMRIQGLLQPSRWYDVNVYPSNEGITLYYIDRTEQIRSEKALLQILEENRQQRDLLQTIFESDPSGIAVFTTDDLKFQFANRAYQALVPAPTLDPVGKTIEEVWPSSLGFQVLTTYLPPMEEGLPVEYEKISRRFPNGSLRHFRVHVQSMSWKGRPANLVVAWEITQLQEAKAALQEYAEKLQRSNQDLQDFAMIASHDLQEPLRKIETFGEMVSLKSNQLDERGQDYVKRMRDAATRMRTMVNGLLQLSRVATQARPFVRVELAELAGEIVSDLDHQVRRTAGTVHVEPLPSVEADPLQMRQLLQNLISNALKFHKPGTAPVVTVSGRQLPGSVEISVADNGIGFDLENGERIFQPFQRLVSKTDYEGSGMGLAICHRIVERHGGEIHAVSKPGEGTVFVVTLPIRHAEAVHGAPGEDPSND